MVKLSPEGGIVEGGYPASTSFGRWATEMNLQLAAGDRVLVASSDFFDRVRVDDYTRDAWFTYDFNGTVIPKATVFDITPQLAVHEGHLIRPPVVLPELPEELPSGKGEGEETLRWNSRPCHFS